MPRPPLGLKEGKRKREGEAGVEVCAQDGRDPPSDGLRPRGQRGGYTEIKHGIESREGEGRRGGEGFRTDRRKAERRGGREPG